MTAEQYEKESEINEDNDFEIVVEDDTPEEDRGYVDRDDDRSISENTFVSDDEFDEWPDKARKRIGRLTWDAKESKRERRKAERERDQAIVMAQEAIGDVERMGKTISMGEKILLNTLEENADSKISSAKEKFIKAHEEGDAEAMADAQLIMSEGQTARLATKSTQPAQPRTREEINSAYSQTQQSTPGVHPDVQDWIDASEWFNKGGGDNEVKTAAAMQIDRQLMKEGINPAHDPEKYIKELDSRIDKAFGTKSRRSVVEEEEHLEPESRPQRTVVAGSRRTVGGNGKAEKVTLTKSEIAVAKKMGVSLKRYAARKLERQQQEGQ